MQADPGASWPREPQLPSTAAPTPSFPVVSVSVKGQAVIFAGVASLALAYFLWYLGPYSVELGWCGTVYLLTCYQAFVVASYAVLAAGLLVLAMGLVLANRLARRSIRMTGRRSTLWTASQIVLLWGGGLAAGIAGFLAVQVSQKFDFFYVYIPFEDGLLLQTLITVGVLAMGAGWLACQLAMRSIPNGTDAGAAREARA